MKISSVKHCLTEDGSSTLYSDQFGAHYHSTHGALNESMHVFIEHGLEYLRINKNVKRIKILEFGFGTGLNALLALRFASEHAIGIDYHTLEAYPVKATQLQKLNYTTSVGYSKEFDLLHECNWNTKIEVTDQFKIHKSHIKFEDYEEQDNYEIIFFDAFAPTTQSHLWEVPILKKCYNSLSKGGILVTFCAKGSFKRNLKSLGFSVERLPGPPGKREMTRALKI